MAKSIFVVALTAGLLIGCDNAPQPSAQGSAAPRSQIDPFIDRTLQSGSVEMRLGPDQVYWVDDRGGRFRFEGWYAFADGVLTLETARGNPGQAKFPKRCRFLPEATGDAFRLASIDGGCAMLADARFSTPPAR